MQQQDLVSKAQLVSKRQQLDAQVIDIETSLQKKVDLHGCMHVACIVR